MSLATLALVACSPAPPPRPFFPTSFLSAPVPQTFVVSSGSAAPVLPETASPITFPRMAKYPEPGWQIPRLIRFSPDGKLVTFVESETGSDEMALFGLDLTTGAISRLLRASDLAPPKAPSLAEELRNERQRKRIRGITDYAWAKKANVMVVPAAGDVFVREADGKVRRITDTADDELDPQICADGAHVAYVRNGELYAFDLAANKESALTHGAKKGTTRGLSDFNGQEEFDEASGFLWSLDCKHIAYWEVDESAVKEVPVIGYRDTGASLMMQRYPLAGGTNPRVAIRIVDVGSKSSVTVTMPDDAPRYVGRMRFSEDGASLYLQALTRAQTDLEIARADVKTGNAVTIDVSHPTGWAEMTEMAFARRGAEVLTIAENAGHMHLLRLDAKTGKRLGWATSGGWDVTDLVRVDDESDTAYVIATKDEPIGRQLYAVSLKGGEPKRVTTSRGTHEVTLSERAKAFVDLVSAVDAPPRAEVRSLSNALLATIPIAADPDMASLGIRPPDTFTVDTPGVPTLYGQILAPRQVDPTRRYPLVLMVYGGPFVQTVTDRWAPRLLWQHLADRGFYVMEIDNRGSAGRGPAFSAPIKNQLGTVELTDQLAGLDFVLKRYPIDPARVGIYGHSYGGFMAALAMLKAPGRFKAAVSGSPVTDFRLYDSGYTERYLGQPEADPAGYGGTDLSKLAPNLRGDLFIIHALMDENVHFENTAKLIQALIEAQKRFDLLVFPGERHGYRSPVAKEYALRRVVSYLVDELGPKP